MGNGLWGGPLTRRPALPPLRPQCSPLNLYAQAALLGHGLSGATVMFGLRFVFVWPRAFSDSPKDEHVLHRHLHSDWLPGLQPGRSDLGSSYAGPITALGSVAQAALFEASIPKWREWLSVGNGHSAPFPFPSSTSVSSPLTG